MAEDEAVSEPWDPLSAVDIGILGLIGTLQAFALLICVHLLRWRKWPPYVTKSPILVVIATVSGVLWWVSMAIASGFIEREEGDILAACDFERFVSWSTLCVHTVAFFIRVYRMWRILIKHDSNMWHTEFQVLFMSSVSLIPVIATWIAPHSGYFDENANTCSTNTLSAAVVLFMDLLGFLAICFLWFVCARQLKSVRRQFNEYDTMKRTLLYMTITLTSYAIVVVILLADDLVLQRRVAIFYPLLTTYILLWGSIREPFLMKMLGDDEYLLSYTKGFAELPSPAQLKATLAEQPTVDQLRDELRRYIKTKVAQELVNFYLDSLDREEVKGFFERQAVTMHIVEQYIREGAPDQVNISGECREKILATDVTAFNIFDEARKEVLTVMETNFRKDLVKTEGFLRILDASEEEQLELRLLRARGMLPAGSPSTPGAAAATSLAPPSTAPASKRLPQGSPPGSPPFLQGLKDALRKLPFLVRSCDGTSEAGRRRRRGKGGARVGGTVRVSTDSVGARDRGHRQEGNAPLEPGAALQRGLQEEEEEGEKEKEEEEDAIGREAPRSGGSEVGGAAAIGDVLGQLGMRAGTFVSGGTPDVYGATWTGSSVAGGERSVVFDAAAVCPPPADLAGLEHVAFILPGLENGATSVSPNGCTLKVESYAGEDANTNGSWWVRADAEAGTGRKRQMGEKKDEPGLVVFAHDDGDQVSREDGVEGLEILSPVLTENSPDWVRFSEWIDRGMGGTVGENDGTASRGSMGGGREGARKTMVNLSHDVFGGGGGSSGSSREATSESWRSGTSCWSDIQNVASGSDNTSAPRTPSPLRADAVDAESMLTQLDGIGGSDAE
eukprot:g6499.t1